MLGAKLANVTVNDTGQYTVDGLRSGVAYSFELFVALEDLQLYSQNSSSTIGVTLLGKFADTCCEYYGSQHRNVFPKVGGK